MKQVTAALWIEEGKVFIARRPSGDKLQGKWEFPGGKVEAGETPQQCLRREMAEELGIDVAVRDYFGSSIYTYESGCIELMGYFIQYCTGEMILRAHEEVAWVDPADLISVDFAPADIPLAAALKRHLEEN